MSVCGRLLASGMSGVASRWGRVAGPRVLTCSGTSAMRAASCKLHASSTIATLPGSSYGYWEPGQFHPKKAVILTKVSRWEQKLVLVHLSAMKPPDQV